jgi:tetratricopeptide (TPR) repeat protein
VELDATPVLELTDAVDPEPTVAPSVEPPPELTVPEPRPVAPVRIVERARVASPAPATSPAAASAPAGGDVGAWLEALWERAKTQDDFGGRRPAAREESRSVQAEGHFRKGQERLAAGDPVGAVEALGLAVHLDPNQGDYVAHLGYALYRSKPGSDVIRKEALEHIAKGVKLAPDQVTPLLFLGRVFRETGAAASAAKVFRKALALSPEHHEILQELCLVQVDPPKSKKKGGLLGRLRGD